ISYIMMIGYVTLLPMMSLIREILRSFVFFLQAEDGIRDRNVTGVQTCALPICLHEVADPAGLPAAADPADVDALAQDLAVAARVDEVATAVGSSYRYRAGNRVG